MPPDPLPSGAFAILARGWQCVPCPLVSRERGVWASSGAPGGVVRRLPAGPSSAWRSEAGASAWLAAQAGVGPARALVRLEAPAGERLPARYRVESSALAGPGASEPWRLELEVDDNRARTRAHVVEFDGQSALRVVFELAAGELAALARLDVHDASDGTDDVWLVLGDELASAALSEGPGARGFAEALHARYPGYFPVLIDETRAGETPRAVLSRLAELLAVHPHATRVALAFGAGAALDGAALDGAALGPLAAALLAAGRVPLFARAPQSEPGLGREVEAFNAQLVALEASLGLAPGPDASALGIDWPALGAAGVRALPATARQALSELWVDAADVFYVPQ